MINHLSKLSLFVVIFCGCTASENNAPLGSADKPIRMYFVPSTEADTVITSAKSIADAIEERTGLRVITKVPPSYSVVVTELETGRADVAWLPTFAYVYAKERCDIDVELTLLRHGEDHYRGEILVLADSGIESLEDLDGKRVAYSDPLSTSGYLYPAAILTKADVTPSNTVFMGGHAQTVMAVYQGNVDAGCAFWSPEQPDGSIGDARKLLLDKWPDVESKVKILAKTDPIPNDTVSFRHDFPEETKEQIVQALLDYVDTPEGLKALSELYSITGFVRSDDSRYDSVRDVLTAEGKTAAEFLD